MLIEDKLSEYLVNSGKEKAIARSFKKLHGVDVKKVDIQKVTTYFLKDGIDENKWDNFNLIDDIHKMLEKIYPNSLITHDFDRFRIEEQ